MRESTLERRACEMIRQLGGISYKWVSPGHPGIPDRICIMPGNRIVFIEFKKPYRKNGLSNRQWKACTRLQGFGCAVWVVNDLEALRAKLEALKGGEACRL